MISGTHSTVIYQAPTMCLLGTTVLGLEDKWVYLGKCLSYTRHSMNNCWINKWMSSPKPVGAELWWHSVQFIYPLLLSTASIQKHQMKANVYWVLMSWWAPEVLTTFIFTVSLGNLRTKKVINFKKFKHVHNQTVCR